MSAPVVLTQAAQPGGFTTAEGEPVSALSDRAIESRLNGDTHPWAQANASPWGWNDQHPAGGSRVGWVLKSGGRQVASFAFRINPQSIIRQEGSRSQLCPTKRAFYLDDFGAGAETIQIRQLVGTGGTIRNGFVTLRDHVLEFYEQIYLRALGTGYKNPVQVWFYDNHLFDGAVKAGKKMLPQMVYFPPNSCQLTRAVNLNNVWQFELTMVSLEKAQTTPPGAGRSPRGTNLVIVRHDQDLHQLARKHAGKHPTTKRVHAVERELMRLNPKIRQNRYVPIFKPGFGEVPIKEHVFVKRLHVITGEKILLPAR